MVAYRCLVARPLNVLVTMGSWASCALMRIACGTRRSMSLNPTVGPPCLSTSVLARTVLLYGSTE